METKAVIDRIEGSLAVLLIGDEETKSDVPLGRLPAGAKEGDWLQLTIVNNEITGIRIDRRQTEQRRRLIEAKLEFLRKKRTAK